MKSFIALSWAGAIAKGVPWHARSVTQGRVLYMMGEDEVDAAGRVNAWADHQGTTYRCDLHVSIATTAPLALTRRQPPLTVTMVP